MFGGYGLRDSFETRGDFWLPSDPDKKLSGTLTYRPGQIGLELHGSFAHPAAELPEAELLNGHTNDGPCVLWRVIRRAGRTTFSNERVVSHSTWTSEHLFVGLNVDRSDDLRFRTLSVQFDALGNWLGRAAFEIDVVRRVAHYRPDPPFATALPTQEGALELVTHLRSSPGFGRLVWEEEPEFRFRPLEINHYEWYLERLGHLRSLMGVLVGSPVTPTRITAGIGTEYPDEVTVFSLVAGENAREPPHPAQMLMSRAALGDRLSEVIQLWFEKREALRTTNALLFGSQYVGNLPRDAEFLALTQALETLHRRLWGGFYMNEADYQAVEQTLVDAIPSDIARAHRDALKTRIHFGNEFAQRKRFNELMKSLDKETRELVAPIAQDFVERIVEERNYLTHYPSGEAEPMSPAERFYAIIRLRAFLILLLLAQVNITGADASEALSRTQWYRGYLGSL
jgi:ApeA N-terminal domain 1